MAILRSEQGCPWDREQDHKTLLPHLIEEAYELIEAVNRGEPELIKEELGDLLLNVVFHAQLASEAGSFQIGNVITSIRDKLIHRHPHVFGDKRGSVKSAKEVKRVWGDAKRDEGKKSMLAGIPKHMPALQRAWRLTDKAAGVGFDWEKPHQVVDQIKEELEELREALDSNNQEGLVEEMGDMLFCFVNLARQLKFDPELALRQANDKFTDRFTKMEQMAAAEQRHLADYSLEEQEAMWEAAKKS